MSNCGGAWGGEKKVPAASPIQHTKRVLNPMRKDGAWRTRKFNSKAQADPSPPFAQNATGFGMTTVAVG